MATKTIIGRKRESRSSAQTVKNAPRPKKSCVFCETGTLPHYTDASTLRKFLSDRAKIVSRTRTGVCSKHQRLVSLEVKHARHLSLLPFVARV